MITLNKEKDNTQEIKALAICCEEVIEQQIIPELSLIYTIQINHYEDFLKYLYLIESVIKSAAIIQQLRSIQNNLQIDLASSTLTHEIEQLKQNKDFNTKYNNLFQFYYHDQPKINAFLLTAESLFSPRTYIMDLQYIINLAHKGLAYTTNIAKYELPATYYCYTKKFNEQFSLFLHTIINDTFDDYNKKLYNKYHFMPISQEAFSSVMLTFAFRLQSAIQFIQHYYTAQELIEGNIQFQDDLDHYFLNFVGKVRSESFST